MKVYCILKIKFSTSKKKQNCSSGYFEVFCEYFTLCGGSFLYSQLKIIAVCEIYSFNWHVVLRVSFYDFITNKRINSECGSVIFNNEVIDASGKDNHATNYTVYQSATNGG